MDISLIDHREIMDRSWIDHRYRDLGRLGGASGGLGGVLEPILGVLEVSWRPYGPR